MAASTYYGVETIIGGLGTTAHWFKVGLTSSTSDAPQRRYAAIEILIDSTADGFVRRGAAASSTGATGNWIIPGGRQPVTVAYSTKISVVAASTATAYVRGVPRALLD